MKMETTIKVLTLNCWGIVGVSKNRVERITAIATHLASSDYDFVFLQEIWSESDYKLICSKTETVLPHSFYFHSGAIGSGVCIFSNSPILDTCLQRYSLNGYAHRIHHGDWFGGKAVGLCKTFHKGLHISLFVTHLHAEYDNHADQYLGHRVVQAFEFSQFVKLSSECSDLTIVAGDFNTEPEDVAYDLIKYNTGCCDAFTEQLQTPHVGSGGTCCHPRNLYTSSRDRKEWPTGQRIDYIFYKSNKGTSIQCVSCETPLTNIPNSQNIPYSDHEAVVALLQVSKSADAIGTPRSESALAACLAEVQCILTQSLSAQRGDRLFYLLMGALTLCLLLSTLPFDLPLPFSVLMAFLRIILTLSFAFMLWMGVVMIKIEGSALRAAHQGMTVLANTFDARNGS